MDGWRSRNPFIRLQDLRTALTFGRHRKLQYIVLEEPSREALLHILPTLERQVVVLDHPMPPNEEPQGETQFGPPFRFGFLGLAIREKGFGTFLEIASALSAKFPQLVEFHAIGSHAIGSTGKNWNSFQINSLATKPRTELWSRSEFISHLQKLHYICLPYEAQVYTLRPSGVLLDAIAWGKPFIASPVPIAGHLVARYGDIGYLCSDVQEFRTTIQRIISEADSNRYRSQVQGLRRVRAARSPESLALKYRHLCSKLALRVS